MGIGPVGGVDQVDGDTLLAVGESIVQNQIVMLQRRIGEEVKSEIISEEAQSSG